MSCLHHTCVTTNVIGRFGDFAINRLFRNTFSCLSVRFSPRLELDVAAVSGSGSVSPPFHDPRRLASRVFLRSHHRSRSLLRSDTSRIHYSIICSDKVFVCVVALSQLHAGFPSVCQLWCWISRSLSSWKMCKNCSVGQSISSVRCLQMVCIVCVLALLPTLFAPVPGTVADSCRPSGRTSNEFSFCAFGFDTFCPFYE